ncbi:MAG: hypothetical protein ACFFDN_12220 [Candidatus Hodarchaeota archaeon]
MDRVKLSKKLIQKSKKERSNDSVIYEKEIKDLNKILKELGIYIFYYERRGGA